ncbi:MAG: PTS system mannose/fructose/sorbose family transporter subunit IID [Calditrichota bacterium]
MALSNREVRRMAFRSLFLQVLLNFRSMQGPCYLFILWNWIRQSRTRNSDAACASNYLNSHPVLSSLAVGALRRRVEDGDAQRDPEGFAQWQNQISGPLGMVGDSLIWDRWKPLIFSFAVLVMLWIPRIEIWFGVAIGCLLLYNIPLIQIRMWGIRAGYELGERVLDVLSHPIVNRLRKRLAVAGAILAGLMVATALVRTGKESVIHAAQLATALVIGIIGVRLVWRILWTALLALTGAILLPYVIDRLSNFF